MKHIVRSAVLIVAAMVGSAIVLAVLMEAAKNLSLLSNLPADFLPAEATILLLHQPTDKTTAFWSERLTLKDVSQEVEAIAYVQLPSSTKGSVVFTRNSADTSRTLGVYGIDISDQLLLPVLGAQPTALGKENVYRAFKRSIPTNIPWVYATRTMLSEQNIFGLRVLQNLLLGTGKEFGYTVNENRAQLLRSKTERPWREAPKEVPHLENRIFALSFINGADAFTQWKHALKAKDETVLESVLRSFTSKFGTSVSFTYDILELTKEPGALQLTQTGGSIVTVLSGAHAKGSTLNRIIDTLHQSFEATLPTTRVTSRILDQRFSTTDLRHDESIIQKSTEQIQDWWITGTRHIDQPNGLFTATRNNQFIISTNKAILLAALQTNDTLITEPRLGTRTSEGFVDTAKLAASIKEILPKEAAILDTLGTEPLLFFSEWKADVQSHTIQLPENSYQLLDSLL